ncbi:dihydrofolate reductase family protein [Stenotrophomonas sp. 24(2023)]|uniref:dihydrofolate reductase family protein n=1 Tax=Stenotrophomonas sp. 24(2023) TaxID=3068324 RepID=UPI0027DF02A7|nr:dihydrofolate reductase family protein [Stenotrophomonas sp. 24(2023)]WMJ68963.1 dihydrofolate reductase family protein [Stenotrophomonas sp. 24(2023)]
MAVSQGRVRAYLGCSLDGFIAGPDNALDWLGADYARAGDIAAAHDYLSFDTFMGSVGCLLMGRTTYDVVAGMEAWPYGPCPVLVATHRPIDAAPPTVMPRAGALPALVAQARQLAQGRDVYLDGGTLVRQGLQAGIVDELVLTWLPLLLGAGTRLFDGLEQPHHLQFGAAAASGTGLLQVHIRPLRPSPPGAAAR